MIHDRRIRVALIPMIGGLLTLLCSSFVLAQDSADLLAPYREASTKKWAKDMARFADLNAVLESSTNHILFCGSSSIRLWKTIAEDMMPYDVIQRGFGGSTWSDVAVHTEQLIAPHTFRGVIFFLANDIKGKDTDKDPAEILRLVKFVAGKVRKTNPRAQLFFIATTPTEARWKVWPRVKSVNDLIKAWTEERDGLHFIPTEDLYLGEDQTPNAALFVGDKLHLNREGYKRWGKRIRSVLDQEF